MIYNNNKYCKFKREEIDFMPTREKTFEQILLQIKKHLTSIEDYYADENYGTALLVAAVKREQENIVSLVRQLMSYEDLLKRCCGTDKGDNNYDGVPF